MTRNQALTLLIGIAACGGGSGGVSPSELGGAIATASCSKLSSCCTAAEFKDATLGADDVTECKALFTAFGGILGKILDDSIAKGRVIYHADRMADCIAAIDDVSCLEFSRGGLDNIPVDACENPFEPLVASGGECGEDFDCTSGYCSGETTDFDGNITYGTCGTAPVAGQPCDHNECAPGAFCDLGTTCVATKADGASCTSDDQCASDSCNGDNPGTCGVQTSCDGN